MKTFPLQVFVRFVLLALLMFANTTHAEEAQDMQKIDDSEMRTLTGGFELPNGIVLNVGIDNQVSINGSQVADAQFNFNGNSYSAFNSHYQTQGNGGTTSINLTAMQSVIQNSANNMSIDQQRTISIDMSNATKNLFQNMNMFSVLQMQVLNGLRNGVH